MRVVVLLVALLGAGCNPFAPSRTVEGDWIASIGKFSFVCLALRQDGDTVTGTATAISDGFLLYEGVAVNGEHPHVQFTVGATNTQPCCHHLAGWRFSGRQDSSGDILGQYGSVDVRFRPPEAIRCEPFRSGP